MKRALGVILTFIMAICGTFVEPLTANAREGNIHAEYLAKKAAGLDVYELIDTDGTVWGYFEPYSESNPRPMQENVINVIYDIRMLVPPNSTVYDNRVCDIKEGYKIFLDISQNPTGYTGYIILYNNDTGAAHLFPQTATTNGWSGSIVVDEAGNYTFGIYNASSVLIMYTGSYSY